jgi:hypothetical protein
VAAFALEDSISFPFFVYEGKWNVYKRTSLSSLNPHMFTTMDLMSESKMLNYKENSMKVKIGAEERFPAPGSKESMKVCSRKRTE